jgi:hypothetical protein
MFEEEPKKQDRVDLSKNIFYIADYEDWVSEYETLKAKSKELWESTGLPSDIRAGWYEAAKSGKLHSVGPYTVSLDVIENIEEDTKRLLDNAGIKIKKEKHYDSSYIEEVKSSEKALREQVETLTKQIFTLLDLVAELREKEKTHTTSGG